MTIKKGDTVGDYKIIDLAGSGGMGDVYKIEHVITKRVEAMKVLPTGIGSGPEDVQRFEREIEVQARLHHPNIVALYNAVRDDQSIALIMEYVEGESLERILRRGRLPLPMAADYARQVLAALAYAHNQGVIHRDVTPANIIITPEGTAKLTDFGLALTAGSHLPSAGVAVGSAWYMSPEQVRGVTQPDARTDLYAMGAVLHEMLTSRKLFDADGSFAVLRAQMVEVPRPPSAFNRDVPAALDEIIARTLAKDPAARFQSADEFRIALDGAIAEMRPPGAVSEIKREIPSLRAAVALVLASATLVAIVCTAVLWRHTTRVVAGAHVSPDVVSKPAPVAAPPLATTPPVVAPPSPPEQAVAIPLPEVPIEAAKPARRSGMPPAAAVQQPGKKTVVVSVTGGSVEPPLPIPAPKPPVEVPQRAAENVVTPEPAAPPVMASSTSTETPPVTPAPEEIKPKKTGNRFTRMLGKLNPLHKGDKDKNDSATPAKTAPAAGVVK